MRALFVCLWVFVLVGCQEPSGGGVRFGLAASPVTLDPRYATDAASTRINRLLYRHLVDFDERFRPVPALARWERRGPTRYRFVLGDSGRRFHDGRRLTASDVKATYDSMLDSANGSPHRGSLEVIKRIRALDEDSVVFELERPDPMFPGRLAIGILPKDLIAREHPFGRRPVGSGPFSFLDWQDEGRLRLRRRSDGLTVEFLRVKDPTMRVLKLARGEIDMLQGDLPPELVSWLADGDDVQVRTARGSTFAYLGFNMEDAVTGNAFVRKAIAHAVDRVAIIRHVMGGAARPASALLPPGHWAGHPALASIEHDPARARRLLERAGYGPGRTLRIVYKTSNDPFRVRLATIIQDQLARVGIDVELESYDWGTFYGDIKAGRFQMYSLAWVGLKMPDVFRYVFHSESVPPDGANRGRFASAAVDRLIERAERTHDREQQARLYRELQEHLLKEMPYVPMWYEDNVLVARRSIRGYELSRDGNYDGLVNVRRVPEQTYALKH
ncbi:MAG: ABC transporter substrate-binding protein [Gammaproteobacteria bacterium]|nr:ABC transporter substrate-binding protein [Gammaproteobacteria bacterium]NIR84973.1 ABC transporter substrate-binding protein [Gammaproteobacteria bacterium]NIR91822.1 ABC transporter substrate-binding protein [Gammaproteobacteria bacterium]NIU06020.1 ABC transporter substrate-binding protein [Gammaproteobacteria bacterium]NIV53067.1 ABC transporter substrate-binding protein [Gammaproteobacteria bacterium]